ncbi:hypothetical protein, partial [Neisseria sicca]|uniref:hypothetical protein n=1 Tax=Neisseria sicca TaxID=490 RepID=UPI001C998210
GRLKRWKRWGRVGVGWKWEGVGCWVLGWIWGRKKRGWSLGIGGWIEKESEFILCMVEDVREEEKSLVLVGSGNGGIGCGVEDLVREQW